MKSWIVVFFNTTWFPSIKVVEVEASDIYSAISQTGFSINDIVSAKLKGL